MVFPEDPAFPHVFIHHYALRLVDVVPKACRRSAAWNPNATESQRKVPLMSRGAATSSKSTATSSQGHYYTNYVIYTIGLCVVVPFGDPLAPTSEQLQWVSVTRFQLGQGDGPSWAAPHGGLTRGGLGCGPRVQGHQIIPKSCHLLERAVFSNMKGMCTQDPG